MGESGREGEVWESGRVRERERRREGEVWERWGGVVGTRKGSESGQIVGDIGIETGE